MSMNTTMALDKTHDHTILLSQSSMLRGKNLKGYFRLLIVPLTLQCIYRSYSEILLFRSRYKHHLSKSQGSNTALEQPFGALLLKNTENLVVLVRFASCKISATYGREYCK